ncbi:ABC transporter substrate-binding protein [Paenibacillus sp. SAF-054]|uniref:ABC transporter substrate-binding protein n=1 Tax=unclassified Paenibacillus TaxID=185978 RepID=UPI003F813B95
MLKKKSLLTVVMSALLVTALAGCGSTDGKKTESESAGSGSGQTESKTYKVAISQIVEHPSLDATREGFLAALKDAGLTDGDNLKVNYKNAQDDQTNNLSIAKTIASEKNDLVLAIATPSAQAVVKEVKDSPVLFAAVTDPMDAKLVSNLDKPGGNVSGVSDTNPAAVQKLMEFIAKNFPNVKTVGVVINEGESNAVVMSKNAEEALSKHNIKLVKAAITNTSEVKQAAESLVGRADAIFITLDNRVVSGVDTIIQVANKNHIPFFSSDRDTVEKGAFATVGFKYYDHGYQVGQMAVDILKNGKNPGDMKVTMQEKLDLILNLKAAEAQGITVTDEMKNEVQDKENNIIQ